VSRIKVVEVDASMIDEVHNLVRRFDNPLATRQRWLTALDQPWRPPNRPSGYASIVDGEMVAFLGALYSKRVLDGQPFEFCNFHSLICDPAHARSALRLIMRAEKVENLHSTVLTPVRNVHHMLIRMGFRPVDHRLLALRPLARGRDRSGGAGLTMTHGPEAIIDRVDEHQARLITDHAATDCRYLLAERDGQRCLVIYQRLGIRVPYGFVLHVGDRQLLQRASGPIRQEIMNDLGVRLVGVDSRMAGGRLPGSMALPTDTRRMLRSEVVPPHLVYNLYSEFPVLGVEAVPSPREELRQRLFPVLRRYLPTR
jgi:hypothetical protein